MKRRDFCNGTLNLGLKLGALTLTGLPFGAFAQTDRLPQFLIMVRLDGGWDTSLSLDPWTNDQRLDEADCFVEYRKDELLPFANGFVGPAMKPLQSHFAKMTILRGLFLSASDNGHDGASNYQITGDGQGHLGILNAELEGQISKSLFGIMSNAAVPIGNTNPTIWDINDVRFNKRLDNSSSLLNFQGRTSDLDKARKALARGTTQISAFNAELQKFGNDIKEEHILVASLLARTSSSATLRLTEGSLDTHSDHPVTHLKNLTSGMERLKTLLDLLSSAPGVTELGQKVETKTLLDQTTVMVTSDFTRTPALNSSKGKDHNPQMNANLIISPGMKPGIVGGSNVIGRAQSKTGVAYHVAAPMDTQTFEVVNRRENAFLLRPENVIATVTRAMGFDPAKIAPSLGSARILNSLVKS